MTYRPEPETMIAEVVTPAMIVSLINVRGGLRHESVAPSCPAGSATCPPFAHLAAVPQTGVHWPATAVMTAVAAALGVLGSVSKSPSAVRLVKLA